MKPEAKVGLLFIATVLMLVAFIYFLGFMNTFSSQKELHIAYNFAGGIEVGSPVRAMGIKVGKVKSIQFVPNLKLPNGDEVKLKITVMIDRKAWSTIRKDSRFFINLAGVIGEKFIEITPGSQSSPELSPEDIVRGEDPPRVDQLISQSYGLAGKIMDLFENNKSTVVDTVKNVNELVKNTNRLLIKVNKLEKQKELADLIDYLNIIAKDTAYFTRSLRSPQNQKTAQLLRQLIWRLEGLDSKTIRKFLQDEGIRAKIF